MMGIFNLTYIYALFYSMMMLCRAGDDIIPYMWIPHHIISLTKILYLI